MNSYQITEIINFGKFKGKTLQEIFEVELSYVQWCILNLDHFYID